MKNKILNIGILFVGLAVVFFAFNVRANEDEVKSNGLNIENKLQVNTSNEGEDFQIQVQNQEQVQVGNQAENSVRVEIKSNDNNSENKKLDDDSDNDGLESVDSDEDELGDDSNKGMKGEREDKSNMEKEKNIIREERRSMVANAVQEMLQLADKDGGIGEQVRVIAQNHVESHDKIEASLKKVQERSGFVKFLIGPKYNDINETKMLLEQNKEQIRQLNEVKTQVSNEGDAQVLDEQIRVLEQANVDIENSLQTSEKGFSLFGWMNKIFSK